MDWTAIVLLDLTLGRNSMDNPRSRSGGEGGGGGGPGGLDPCLLFISPLFRLGFRLSAYTAVSIGPH